MVKETDIWNCSTGEFVGKGEFRQKIKVLGYISGTGIEMIFNGQICNESGCDNIRDQKINTPTLIVSGPILAADPSTTTNTEAATPAETTAQNFDSAQIAVTNNTESNPNQPAYRSGKSVAAKTFNGMAGEEKSEGFMGLFILAF